MFHWKSKGRKTRGRPRRTWKDEMYTAMNERDLRMGEWNSRRQWNMKVGRRRQTFQNRAIYIYIYIHSFSSLSYDRSKVSSKASSPHSAIQSLLI
jgi:hypothetical protein